MRGYIVASTNPVLSSKVESFITDIEDRYALIIKQEFPVSSSDDGHIQLVVWSENLQSVLLFLLDLDGELRHMAAIIGKEAKRGNWTKEKVSRPLVKNYGQEGCAPFDSLPSHVSNGRWEVENVNWRHPHWFSRLFIGEWYNLASC